MEFYQLTFPFDRIFVDDVDVTGKLGGKAYATFGIESSGTIVIVRPDGYVSMVAPFTELADLNAYFSSFMTPS